MTNSFSFKSIFFLLAIAYVVFFVYIKTFDSEMFSMHGYPIHDGGDSYEYALLAKNISETGAFTLSEDTFTPEMFRTPGYSVFLSALFHFDPTLHLAIMVQVVLVLFSGLLLFALSKSVVPNPWPYILVLLFVFDPSTVFYSLSVWSDIPYIFLTLFAVYLLFAYSTKNPFFVIGIGAVLGFATLVRSVGEIAFFVIAFCFAIHLLKSLPFKKTLTLLLLLLVGYSAIVGPWYARNYFYSGTAALSSTGAHALLFFDARQFLIDRKSQTPNEVDAFITKQLPQVSVEELRSVAYNEQITNLGKSIISQYPIEYATYHALGVVNFFVSSGIRDISLNLPRLSRLLVSSGLIGDGSVNLKEGVGGNVLNTIAYALTKEPLLTFERLLRICIVLLAGVGFIGSLFTRRPTRYMLLLLSGLLVAYYALATGPVSYPRYRIPAEPFLLILAAVGAEYIYSAFKKLRGSRGTLKAPAPQLERQAL
jgi:hypothetical protein